MRWVQGSLRLPQRLPDFGRVARVATIAVVVVPVVLLLLLRRLSLSPYGAAANTVVTRASSTHRPSTLTLTNSHGDSGNLSSASLPFTLAAQWRLGESVSLRGLYWLDANGDGCLDLLIDSRAADSQLLLNRARCWEPAADEAQFRLVSEPALGLQWPRSGSSDATSTLITDVDGDEAVDVCQYRCGCEDTGGSAEDDRAARGGTTGERAEEPGSAAACDFRCSLQCAVNTAARSAGASTRFTVLDPIAVPAPSPLPSSSSPVSTSLLAVDWNEDGVADVLLQSPSSPLQFSSFSLHAVNLPPALPNTAGAAALARVVISYEWPPPAPRIPLLCLRAAQPDTAFAAAAATPAGESPCLVAAAERRTLMMRPPAAARSLAAAEAAKPQGSSGCQQLLVAELDDAAPIEIVCIGALFPSQVRVFQPGKGSNGVGVTTGWRQRPSWAVDSQQQEGEEAQLAVRQACLGDYNSDSWPDYVLASHRVVLASALRQYGTDRSFIAYRRTVLSAPAAASGSVLSVSCLDLDNDGDLDILAVHEDEQGRALPVLYYNNKTSTGIRFFAVMAMPLSEQQGPGTAGSAASRAAAGPVGVVVGDFDRDGWLDFAIGHRSGAVQLYRNSRQHPLGQDRYSDTGESEGQETPGHSFARRHANHWLQVDVHGKHRNCAAAVATMQLTLGSSRRRRIIFAASGGSSFAAVQTQHQPWLHFGLGRHAMLDRLSVSWPWRALKLTDLAADQHLQLLGPFRNRPVPEPLLPMFKGYGFAEREHGPCVRPGWQRLRPSLFVLGMPKCGTTSLTDALARHPRVLRPSAKELHYFPHLHADLPADRWYQPHFPCGISSRHVTFDASTHYLYELAVPSQLLGLYPTARLIVLLRDPVARAFSHYRMSHRDTENPALRMNASAADFHSRAEAWIAGFNRCVSRQLEMAEKDAVGGGLDAAQDLCSYDYAHREFSGGLYSVLLLRWLPLLRDRSPFPLLLIALEQLHREPAAVINFLFSAVLGLPERPQPLLPRTNSASDRIEAVWPQTEQLLRQFYAPFNQRLSQLLPFHNGFVPDWLHSGADQAGKGDSDRSARAAAVASLEQVEGEQ